MIENRPKAPHAVLAAIVLGLAVVAVVQSPNTPTAPQGRAVESVRLGTPPNPEALRVGLTGAPVLGRPWQPFVDHSTFMPDANFDFLVLSKDPANRMLPGIGTLLVDPDRPFVVRVVPAGEPFLLRVPLNASTIGKTYTVQAASTDGIGPQLTNAIDVIVGAPPRPQPQDRR